MTLEKSLLEPIVVGSARDALLDALCLHVERVIADSCCAILLGDSSSSGVRQVHGPSLPDGAGTALERVSLASAPDICAAMTAGDLGVAAEQPEVARAARGFGLQAALALPFCGDTVGARGLMIVFQRHASLLTAMERAAVQEAARFAGLLPRDQTSESVPVVESPPSFQEIVENLPVTAYALRIGTTTTASYVSPRVAEVLGRRPEECEAHPEHWFAHVHPDDRERIAAEVALARLTATPLTMEYRVVSRGGRVIWIRDLANLVKMTAAGEELWHGIQFDVTEEKTAESQLQHLAFYDSLTGLPNRRLCIDRIESVLSEPDGPQLALLFIDLDRFKFINDGIGHAAGDELLVAVARRLSDHVTGHGSLARFGGDEFVAVLTGIALSDVEALAGRLLAALRRPFKVNGYELDVEGTIGIALASPELRTPEALLRASDVALYRAKAGGRGGYAVYDPRIDEQSPDRFEREAELRRALASREFQIAYQPVVDIATHQILAVEALLRWNHPQYGMLESSEFIEFADETGLIVPLGKWVIEEACRQMRRWQDLYPAARSLQVSINLSGRQFRQASLATDVAMVLRQTGLSPANLALEIKEGDALADSAAVAATLKEFRRLGVRVTIDDFGKGWAALGSLTRFTIDDLKIDGSCVSRLGQEPQDLDVVRALVGMAKAIGLDVTAEAVETSEQLAMLRELGCDRAQGRHLAPPLMVEELEQLFQRTDELGLRPGG